MRLRQAAVIVAFSLLTSAAPAYAENAWVLWEHFTGVMRGQAEDFWLLRDADETRAGCLQRAEQEVEIQTGGRPESLRGKMAQVDLRLGWSRPISYIQSSRTLHRERKCPTRPTSVTFATAELREVALAGGQDSRLPGTTPASGIAATAGSDSRRHGFACDRLLASSLPTRSNETGRRRARRWPESLAR